MRLSQSGIAQLYFYALALGIVLGLFFDLIRFPRMLFTRKAEPKKEGAKTNLRKRRVRGVFVFLEDFLFCVFASVAVILLFYEHNKGKIRPFTFCLLLGAFFLYRFTVGKWIRAFLRLFAGWVRKAVRFVCKLLWKPTKKLLNAIRKLIKKIGSILQKRMEKRARKNYTKRLFAMVEQNAAGLLPDGAILKKKEVTNNKGGAHGGGKGKKDHRPKQKSVA